MNPFLVVVGVRGLLPACVRAVFSQRFCFKFWSVTKLCDNFLPSKPSKPLSNPRHSIDRQFESFPRSKILQKRSLKELIGVAIEEGFWMGGGGIGGREKN